MSFRDNLQRLRATRNMTQEQLAMLLGVSRQSVTKWESEKSYPEMDKLLKICQLFNCTLDELVQGDLTSREADPGAEPPIPSGPATDVCGYDEHMRAYARRIATGVSVIVLGLAVSMLLEGVSLVPGADPAVLMVACLSIGVVAGLAFLVPAVMEHGAFVKAHPFIEDFYTESDRADARRALARALPVGIGAVLLGVLCAMAFDSHGAGDGLGPCLMFVCVAVGVWVIIDCSVLYGRTNVEEYNRHAADENDPDLSSSSLDEAQKAALLKERRRKKRVDGICGVIMLVSTIVALVWLFVAPGWTSGSLAHLFWLPWVVGGIACGIVSVLAETFGEA